MMDPEEKKVAYAADITYGVGNEFGFDHLRDQWPTIQVNEYKDLTIMRLSMKWTVS